MRCDMRTILRYALAVMASLCIGSVHAQASADTHAQHHHEMAVGTQISEAQYVMPGLTLIRQDGLKLPVSKALDDGRPVILNFIFTSCTAICPITTQVFAELREQLGARRKEVNMVSISIDPEYDTPRRLKDYGARFGADESWNFYTGTSQDSISLQKAFATYRGDKMNHVAVTFMRASPGKPWLRVDGFASPTTLLAEYRKLLARTS